MGAAAPHLQLGPGGEPPQREGPVLRAPPRLHQLLPADRQDLRSLHRRLQEAVHSRLLQPEGLRLQVHEERVFRHHHPLAALPAGLGPDVHHHQHPQVLPEVHDVVHDCHRDRGRERRRRVRARHLRHHPEDGVPERPGELQLHSQPFGGCAVRLLPVREHLVRVHDPFRPRCGHLALLLRLEQEVQQGHRRAVHARVPPGPGGAHYRQGGWLPVLRGCAAGDVFGLVDPHEEPGARPPRQHHRQAGPVVAAAAAAAAAAVLGGEAAGAVLRGRRRVCRAVRGHGLRAAGAAGAGGLLLRRAHVLGWRRLRQGRQGV
mmetsp:Transcript_88468/g.245701  ORF Transcript_88468/g.245701 Transcript_88468/m.245701 type:complete len:317 (+) Transcript_88468:1830-2780(+)